ncbi:alanine/glycine:cation symporter family protein [Neisseria chenwenguii]|uniref:Sodium:alanine symporter family protein n=1 Tax=Neisseria chenwenguii TaxID=1853278 RepID=A0A220S1M0_9NEIS|nr:sodium:alanine symporter family protein [Neisseria chenwenguii]ASK27381.1 sodium:alanine symporter family protein [Neisseria chenwenguii]ROV56948.1 sodium:alanine symporter family protein [Neisseria chenwenguii]
MTESLHNLVKAVNGPMWDWLIFVLLGTGLFFTLTTGFVQIRLFAQSVRAMLGGRRQGDDPHGITPFQAFVTGLASRVGVGNIAGVAIAISVGGPGAVFWMWLVAFIGMSSAFAESSLAQLFKIRDYDNHHFRGGPAYYITRGLGQRWMGILFALSLIFCFGLVYEAVQSNTVAVAAKVAWGWDEHAVGVALVIMTAPIIFGGIRRVARWAELVVPVMAVLYLLMALYIVGTNVAMIPNVFEMIIGNAFKSDAAGGGLLGGLISQTMMMGIKRGLYSNEAGQGSAPNAAAAAEVKHPVSQGMIQMLGVFVDTMIVCSCTAFIILVSDLPADHGLSGAQLTQAAIVSHVGNWGADFLAVILFLFAFSTIIGNYAYAESNVQFIKSNWQILSLFRMGVLGMVYFGAVNEVPLVWDMADMAMGTMAWINLIAILLLSPLVFLLLKDYTAKLKMGKDPEFKLSEHPGLKRKIKSDIW